MKKKKRIVINNNQKLSKKLRLYFLTWFDNYSFLCEKNISGLDAAAMTERNVRVTLFNPKIKVKLYRVMIWSEFLNFLAQKKHN